MSDATWRDRMEPFDADARRPWVNDPSKEPPLPRPDVVARDALAKVLRFGIPDLKAERGADAIIASGVLDQLRADVLREADVRMFGTEDGGFLHNDDTSVPVGEFRRLLYDGQVDQR